MNTPVEDVHERIAKLRELIAAARRDEADLRQRLEANPADTRDLLSSRVAEREEELHSLQEKRETVERRLSECGLQYKSELADKQRFVRNLQASVDQLHSRLSHQVASFENDDGSRARAALTFIADASRMREEEIALQKMTQSELRAAVACTQTLVGASKVAQVSTREAVTAQRDAKIAAAIETMLNERHTILWELANVQRVNAQYTTVLRHQDVNPAPSSAANGDANGTAGVVAVREGATTAVVAASVADKWLSQKHHQMRIEADALRDSVVKMQAEKASVLASIKSLERLRRSRNQDYSTTLQRIQKETIAAKTHTSRLVASNTRMTNDVEKLRSSLTTLSQQRQQIMGDPLPDE